MALVSDDGIYNNLKHRRAWGDHPSNKTVRPSLYIVRRRTSNYQFNQYTQTEINLRWGQINEDILSKIDNDIEELNKCHASMTDLLQRRHRLRSEICWSMSHQLHMKKMHYDDIRFKLDAHTIHIERMMQAHAQFYLESNMKEARVKIIERLRQMHGKRVKPSELTCIHQVIDVPFPPYAQLSEDTEKRLTSNRPDTHVETDQTYDYNLEQASRPLPQNRDPYIKDEPYKGIGKRQVLLQQVRLIRWSCIAYNNSVVWAAKRPEGIEVGFCTLEEWAARDLWIDRRQRVGDI